MSENEVLHQSHDGSLGVDGTRVAPANSTPAKAPNMWADPVVLLMAGFAGLLLVSGLVFVVVAISMGYLGGSGLSTKSGADLVKAKAEVAQYKNEPQSWFKYITTLSRNGQFTQAQRAISEASSKLAKKDEYDQYISTAQADLFFAQEKYDQAIAQALKAQAAMDDAYNKELKSDSLPNKAKAFGISENYYVLHLLLAGAYSAKGDYKSAVKQLEDYTVKYPNEAGVWIDLGNAYAKAGQKEKAKSAYEEALYYIPDFEEAKQGLKELGEK